MNEKFIKMYLDIAIRISKESHARRLKVGAVFVSPEGVMSIGINGLPAGGSNECEYEDVNNMLTTKPEVSHAEMSLFGKLMRQGVSTKEGSIFLNYSPCIECSKLIVNAGISFVYYLEDYRCNSGIDWLVQNNIKVRKVNYAVV